VTFRLAPEISRARAQRSLSQFDCRRQPGVDIEAADSNGKEVSRAAASSHLSPKWAARRPLESDIRRQMTGYSDSWMPLSPVPDLLKTTERERHIVLTRELEGEVIGAQP
jgi:hypothetical protein